LKDQPSAVSHLHDWSTYFHDEMPESPENDHILQEVIQNRKWQEKIEKRTEAFYQIISKLVKIMHLYTLQ